MTIPERERGYALVAAVASIALFATVALAVLASTRATIGSAVAEVGQAQAAAAADAGVAMALKGLLADGPGGRWSIDGRVRTVDFAAARLAIRIEDERGKVPLNLIEPAQIDLLLEQAGLSGARLAVARDSLLDWVDGDDDAHPDGAESLFYAARGIAPRNGPLESIDELARIRGFDPALVERLRGHVSVDWSSGSFDSRFAHPIAIGVMTEGGIDSPQAIQRARERAGQRAAIDFTAGDSIVGKPLCITVDATLPDGAHASRRAVVELTGAAARPYVIRSYE